MALEYPNFANFCFTNLISHSKMEFKFTASSKFLFITLIKRPFIVYRDFVTSIKFRFMPINYRLKDLVATMTIIIIIIIIFFFKDSLPSLFNDSAPFPDLPQNLVNFYSCYSICKYFNV